MAYPLWPAYSDGMKSLRPLLSAFLGLALLAQGVAVAAAPLAVAASEPAAAQAAAQAEMPCHGDAQAADPADTGLCACCDGGCVDMTGCAFGSLAAVPAIKLQLAPVRQAAIAAAERSAESISPPSRLRPPIVLHV